jgi:cytochrome P450
MTTTVTPAPPTRLGPLPPLLDQGVDAPVVRVRAPTGDEVWLVADHRLGRAVLSDPRFSRAAAALPGAPRINSVNPAPSSMMSMDGADHARLRRLVAGAFAPRRMATLAPRIQRRVDDLLDAMTAAGSPADLVAGFAAPLPVAVISDLLGIPDADLPAVRSWAGVLFDLTASTPTEKARRGFELFGYMSRLVDRKRTEPADDLLGDLTAAHDTGTLSRVELIDLALAMLTAGYETTVGQIGLSVLTLLSDPASRPAGDERSVAAAVEEYLRVVPATPMTFTRVARRDVPLGEVTVRAGEAVVVSLLHANHDPARTSAHLTFGHGPHFCLGAGLARLQVTVALGTLLRRLPGLRLAPGPDAVGWAEGLATRSLTRLVVHW